MSDKETTFLSKARDLLNRRKRYPSYLRDTLELNFQLRVAADYDRDQVSAEQARRALRRAAGFVTAVAAQGKAV